MLFWVVDNCPDTLLAFKSLQVIDPDVLIATPLLFGCIISIELSSLVIDWFADCTIFPDVCVILPATVKLLSVPRSVINDWFGVWIVPNIFPVPVEPTCKAPSICKLLPIVTLSLKLASPLQANFVSTLRVSIAAAVKAFRLPVLITLPDTDKFSAIWTSPCKKSTLSDDMSNELPANISVLSKNLIFETSLILIPSPELLPLIIPSFAFKLSVKLPSLYILIFAALTLEPDKSISGADLTKPL